MQSSWLWYVAAVIWAFSRHRHGGYGACWASDDRHAPWHRGVDLPEGTLMQPAKKESGAGKGSFRQAQAWLHTWCGLWFSWLLYAVFLTGTLAVFEEPITHWMTPEHHAHEQAEARQAGTVPQAQSSLSQRLHGAWHICSGSTLGQTCGSCGLQTPKGRGFTRLLVRSDGQYAAAQLDPKSGSAMDAC
jgi:hypothetical protein